MALSTGSIIRATVNMTLLQQRVANVFDFRITAFAPQTTAAQIAEGLWQDVKTTYRALAGDVLPSTFDSVQVEELFDPAGAFGEYPIPAGERTGTRTFAQATQYAPSFNAVGVKFTVGSRLTRPGQKRVPFLTELDTVSNAVDPAFLALVNAWALNVSSGIVLPIPALGTSLQMVIVGVTPTGALDSQRVQDVTGFVINPNVSSQVSRKAGRGQ